MMRRMGSLFTRGKGTTSDDGLEGVPIRDSPRLNFRVWVTFLPAPGLGIPVVRDSLVTPEGFVVVGVVL